MGPQVYHARPWFRGACVVVSSLLVLVGIEKGTRQYRWLRESNSAISFVSFLWW